jgi:breast cancer 2 susceptibility protein
MKNSCTTSSATFRTAGSGKTIEVPEEKVEEMGLFLKDTSFSEQSTNRLSQKVAKVTVLADKDPRQKSLMDPDQHFFESNLRSYPHSPLRNKEVKLPKHKCDTAETKATPYHQLVSGSDFPRIAHRTSPSCVSKNEIVPSYSMNEGMIQLDSLSEDQGRSGDEVEDATLPRQDVHCSPNDCKILSRSANITGSSRNDLVQTRQKIDMTPIPISLNDKMDGLDASVTKRRETKPRESSSVSSDCQTLKHAIHFGEMSNCPSMCRLHGIREATMLVNCSNSLQLRFDNDGLPHSFEMDGGEQSSKLIGDVADIRLSLIDKGCDSKCIKDEWIRNHTRWIVWKLASYERRFSKFLAGRYLTYHSLVQNLLSRFKREVVNGVRPAVRKILNRDISASKMMILVVCQVISPTEAESDGTPAQSAALELSDGWYSVRGSLDSKLSQYVNDGLIAVGTKLLVSNARLVGAEDGVDPLDEGDGTGCRNYKATLQISANSTRLATWNAKLGFVNILNRRRMPHGHLLVKRISDVVPGGGNIPAIRLFIQRVYPVLYYEKRNHSDPCLQSSMSTMKRRVFTEQEEDSRRRAFEMRKLRVVEKLTDKIQGEVEQVRN